MDILEQHLDPLDESAEGDGEESVGLILEEAEIVDCDLDEESISEECSQFQLHGNARHDTYRVVTVNGTSELSLSQPASNTVQVLATPLNGQFYVISNSNDIFTTQNSRSLSPQVAALEIEAPLNAAPGMKKRDEKRRVTHNEVERRRRDKINNWITKLGKLLPECSNLDEGDGDGKVIFESQSKGGILSRACEYIMDLRETNEGLGQGLREKERLLQEVESLKHVAAGLKADNAQLRARILPKSDAVLGP